MGEVGFEPTRPEGQQSLSLPRLPFRHSPPRKAPRMPQDRFGAFLAVSGNFLMLSVLEAQRLAILGCWLNMYRA